MRPTSSSATARRTHVAKRDYLKEMRDGFERWIKLCCVIGVLWIILNILPYLPTEIGNRVVDRLLRMFGI